MAKIIIQSRNIDTFMMGKNGQGKIKKFLLFPSAFQSFLKMIYLKKTKQF